MVPLFWSAEPAEAAGGARLEFSAKAANGYKISVEGSRGRVTLAVAGRGATATYSVLGRVLAHEIKARFGELGRIAVRFRAIGRPRHTVPPKRCKGRDQITTNGVFVGTIRFRGENGYTQLTRKRVRGSMTEVPKWQCTRGEGGDRGVGPGPGFGKRANAVPVLGAFTPSSRVVFMAMGENESEGLNLTLFLAGTRERRGAMRISRFTLVVAKARNFVVEPGLEAAIVRPPKPFLGEGSFSRDANGSPVWTGSLAVALPGAGAVPLTGLTFTVDLAKPKKASELEALLGPGLLG